MPKCEIFDPLDSGYFYSLSGTGIKNMIVLFCVDFEIILAKIYLRANRVCDKTIFLGCKVEKIVKWLGSNPSASFQHYSGTFFSLWVFYTG